MLTLHWSISCPLEDVRGGWSSWALLLLLQPLHSPGSLLSTGHRWGYCTNTCIHAYRFGVDTRWVGMRNSTCRWITAAWRSHGFGSLHEPNKHKDPDYYPVPQSHGLILPARCPWCHIWMWRVNETLHLLSGLVRLETERGNLHVTDHRSQQQQHSRFFPGPKLQFPSYLLTPFQVFSKKRPPQRARLVALPLCDLLLNNQRKRRGKGTGS